MDYNKLALEIKDDPLKRGYKKMSNDEICVSLRVKDRTRVIDSIPSSTVIEATALTEYVSLSASQRDIYWGMLAGGEIKPSGTRTKQIYASLFAPSSSTRTNLITLATESITRAEELGLGEVYVGHVGKACTQFAIVKEK